MGHDEVGSHKSEVGSYLEGVGRGKFIPDNEGALTLANLHSLTRGDVNVRS